jgi:hypothetical protein
MTNIIESIGCVFDAEAGAAPFRKKIELLAVYSTFPILLYAFVYLCSSSLP